MRYAELECGGCHVILAGNLMTTVSDKVVSGESVRPVTRTKHYTSGQSYQEIKQEKTTHYRTQSSVLCPNCLAARRRRKFFEAILVLALVAGIISWIALNRSNSVSRNVPGNESSPSAASNPSNDAVPEVLKHERQPDSTVNLDRMSADREDVVKGAEISQAKDPPQKPEPEVPSALTEATPEVATALAKAVDKGKSVRWRVGDHHGYAVASEAQSDGCKNVYFSDEIKWDRIGSRLQK